MTLDNEQKLVELLRDAHAAAVSHVLKYDFPPEEATINEAKEAAAWRMLFYHLTGRQPKNTELIRILYR